MIFCTLVIALDWCQNFVSTQYLVNKCIDFHQIVYMHLYWQVTIFLFRLFVTRVMGLEWCQNFVSTQYLQNKWTEIYQILYIHVCINIDIHGLRWDRTCHSCKFVTELWPLIGISVFCFCSKYLAKMDRKYCAVILTWYRLGLLPVIFCKFVTELWPLIDVRIAFCLISW